MGTPELARRARSPAWSVYVLRCRDGSLYTGIATDVARRIAEHARGPRGAKYLRGRGPFTLVFQAEVGDRAHATRAELALKRLPKPAKERLVGVGPTRATEIFEEMIRSIRLSGP
ncbi:MAG TPA: GIY-YIG nuclease family protein [Woeseiaceae bacterium]|nr:GIY-YIG nuclease family protein [Woeseiaceae bacterium]